MSNRFREGLRRHRVLLSALVSVGIVVILGIRAGVRLDTIGDQLDRLNWGAMAAILVFSVSWHTLLGADKWWRILRAQGADVGYWEVFRVRLGSDPVRFVVPLKAGELVNAVYFAKLETLGFSRAAGSVVFDKALNFFGTVVWLYVGIAGMMIAAISKAAVEENEYLVKYLALHTAMGAAVLVLICVRPARRASVALARMMHPKVGRLAAGVLSAFEEFSPLKKTAFLFYGIFFQLRPISVCGMLLVALQPNRVPSLPEFLALGSVVVLMSNIPSMGGIGPREAALMALFAGYAEQATLLSAGLLMSFAVQVLPAIVGIPWMFPLLRAVAPNNGKIVQAEGSPMLLGEEGSQLPVTQVE